jgi:Cd2+/Zn2+-exporting ATPase
MEEECTSRTSHSCGCGQHHDSGEEYGEEKASLGQLAIGVFLFLFTYLTDSIPKEYSLVAYGIAYLLLGSSVIRNAFQNIIHKEPFDENLLMVIATGGAFGIGDYPEAVAVMLFSRIGEMLEEKAVHKSRKQVTEAVDMRPETIQRIIADGTIETIPAENGIAGDSIVVRPGDRIPLDGTVTEGTSRIDTAAITGEPVPVSCQPGTELLSGCINISGTIRMRVTKPLCESMVTKILQSVEEAAARKPRMDRFITRFARTYTPAVVLIAAATAVIPSLVTGNWYYWLYTALTFLVISCPCAIVLSVPLSFFAGIGAASKRGILFKGGIAIEQMKRIGAVVFDKTGTITKGNFIVQQIVPGTGFTEQDVLYYCAGAEQASSHPIAASVIAAVEQRQMVLPSVTESDEIAGEGLSALVAGKTVICGNLKLMNRQHIAVPQQHQTVYGSELYVAVNGRYAGHIIISDTLKEDAVEAVRYIRSLGITTAMLTGDSRQAADYIAKKSGIDVVRAQLLPQDKVQQLDTIRNQYGPVLFVGDGINDAPVLAGADVGAAMGSGADAAVEAADVVFMNSQVQAVPEALRISRMTMAIAVQNVVFALGVKGIVMAAGFTGFASMWAAVFADSGVAVLCVLNSVRILYKK